MPKISFKKNLPSFHVPSGAVLMHALLENGLPVASSCNGEAVCSKCHIEVLAGKENLSPEQPHELRLREKNKISEQFRISCQTKIWGDVILDTKYW